MTKLLKDAASIAAVSSALAFAVACDKSPADTQQEAVEQQREAVQNYEETRAEANKEANEAQREANQEAMAAQKEANQEIGEAREKVAEEGAEANQKIAEANRDALTDIAKARAEMREWSNEKLADIDSEIDKARADAVKATADEKREFNTIMQDVTAQRNAVRDEIAALEQRSAAEWDTFKARVQERIEKLENRVDDARKTL
jgi:chromosome segregation ATPase